MRITKLLLPGLLMLPSVAHAGVLGDILKGMADQNRRSRSQQAAMKSEREEKLDQIQMYIDRIPDEACKLPKRDVEKHISAIVESSDLMPKIRDTVFYSVERAPSPGSSEAIMEELRQERRQREAQDRLRNQAILSGGQVPIGPQALPPEPKYKVSVEDIKAIERINGGLNCTANIWAGSLRFAVTYTIVLDKSDADGWSGDLRVPELSEAYALAHPDRIKIRYQDRNYQDHDLSLAEARLAGAADHQKDLEDERQAAAQKLEYERQAAARKAYEASPAGRAEVAAQKRQRALALKRAAEACVANGGTWGIPISPPRVLGCYYQTIVR